MALTCLKGCERNGKPLRFASIKGWKRHNTDKHSIWTQEELEQAIIADREETTGTSDLGQASFDSFASALPESESEVGQDTAATSAVPGPTASTTTIKTDAAQRKLAAKTAKLKREICQALPRAVESALLRKGPTWAMSKEQKEMFADSIESVFDILDVQFQIQQYNMELKSRIWVFLYPIAVLLGILGLLAAKNTSIETETILEKEKEKEKETKPLVQ